VLDTIICGDCLDVMANIQEHSIDLIITDPPYYIPVNHYNTRKFNTRNFADLGILEHFFKHVFHEYDRILKPNAQFYMFCNGQSYPLFFYHAFGITKSVRPLIWDKLTSINGYGWRHQHELIMWGEMPESKPVPSGDGDILKCRAVKVADRTHPAEKPLEIITKLICKSSKENDTVLDPFGGSGTTAVACRKSNRHYICIEKEQEYIDSARKRLSEVL